MSNEYQGRVIDLSITVPAERDAVWQALTTGEGLQNWFPLKSRASGGEGSKVLLSWGPECEWETTVAEWQPPERLVWKDDPHAMGEQAAVIEFLLEDTGQGETVVRLVQSGFGDEASWDEQYEGTRAGWMAFLFHLAHYLRHHAAEQRLMHRRSQRFSGPRDAIWQRLFLAAGGLLSVPPAELVPGAEFELQLEGLPVICAVVEVVAPGRTLTLRLPDLNQAVLLVELEPGASDCNVGVWLSSYGAAADSAVTTALDARVDALAGNPQHG